jgi:ATPase subunit of ABC transporter with duplicated ATPase domains
MLTVSSLGKSFGARKLFQDVTLQLDAPRRVGLVGANGSGKSTFLKILADEESASEGTITRARGSRLGTLRQDRFLNDEESVLEVAMQGDHEIHAALKQQHQIEGDAANAAEELNRLHDLIVANDGYALEARSSEILVGLGIPQAALRNPLGTLSGGYKLRVLLAQVLIGRPDVILLDEPTNHLDILSIRWLENFLINFSGLAVVISHDQRFLNAITTHILDVDYETIEQYTGNYDAFLRQKSEQLAQKEAVIARQEKQIAEKQAFVDRFRAKATKARQAQSRVKQIEKIQVERLAPSSRREPKFAFVQERPSGKDVLTVEALDKAFGSNVVLKNVNLRVQRGERVAVIGANGMGKSTLLKVLVDRHAADGGSKEWGHEVRVGYFPQNHQEILDKPKQTPLEMVWDGAPREMESTIRGQLGRALFSGDDVKKPIGALSGGECARLIFARLAVEKANVLVLDEPTNHLDIEAIEALARALKSYPGTIIFVSHDRWFVEALGTRIVDVTAEGLVDFPGTYLEYLAKQGDDHLDHEAVAQKAQLARQAEQQSPENKLSWEERKRLQNRRKALPKLRDGVIAQMQELEQEKANILARFEDATFYVNTSDDEIAALQKRQHAITGRLEELMVQWETVEQELAQLGGESES